MRSTTTLIASLAVALTACGPMTLQYVPVDPSAPVVADATKDTTTQRERDERDPGRDDWDRDRPAVDRDTTDHDAWERDRPELPEDQEPEADWQDLDNEDEDRPEKPELPTEDAGERQQPRPPHGQPRPDSVATPRERPDVRPPHVQPRPPRPDSVATPRDRPDVRPPHVQPRPPRPDSTGSRPDLPGQPERPIVDGARDIHIPPGHMPEGEACRLWIEGTPPGRQAAPVPCTRLHGDVPEGAFILYGERVWDTLYDWVAYERRTPGSVPPAILELMRSL